MSHESVAQAERIGLLLKAPLSAAYRQSVDRALPGALEVVDLNPLLQQGPLAAVRRLRRVDLDRLVVPAEDPASYYLMPILKILATFTRAPHLETIGPDLQRESFSRWSALPEAFSFVGNSLLNALLAVRCAVESAWLARRPRVKLTARPPRSVLYVNGNLWFGVTAGGSVGHIAGVVNSLLRRGVVVDFAACAPGAMLDKSHRFVPLVPQRVFGYPVEFNNLRFHYRMARSVARHLASGIRDVVYQRLSLGNFAGVRWSRSYGMPLVTEYNGSEAWVARHWGRPLKFHGLALAAENAMLRHSHLVVTVSDVLRDELRDRGVAPERIVTYPNCIDPTIFDPARFTAADRAHVLLRHGIPKHALVATFIGTFGQWHGVDVLARAIRQWLDEDPVGLAASGLHFMLVGDGMRMGEVREILGDAIHSGPVTLTGLVKQAEAPAYLGASDILLSPHVKNPDGTRFFGSPTKLFEYLAMARPVVASDLDQIGEVLANSLHVESLPAGLPAEDERRLALLCPPGEPGPIVAALRFLAANAAWRAVLGANARREALAKYTWDRHVDAILGGLARVGDADAGGRAGG